MRLNLDKQSEGIIKLLIERGHYSTPEEVISAAIDILVQDQINKDSKTWNDSTTPVEDVMSQLDEGKDSESKES